MLNEYGANVDIYDLTEERTHFTHKLMETNPFEGSKKYDSIIVASVCKANARSISEGSETIIDIKNPTWRL